MPAVHLEVAGEVQGVGFRWFVKELARQHDLSGWVRNLSSGNVEIVASGDQSGIDALMAAARQGPPGAVVKKVLALPPQPQAHHPRPFTILK